MRLQHQLIGAAVLAGTTYFALLRIAEAKNETAVGGRVHRLDRAHRDELEAYEGVRSRLEAIGERAFSARLERLRDDGEIWVAPALGADRWAVFVASLSLVRRIYLRRAALLNPVAHLYPTPPAGIPEDHQRAFAWISLAGALRHELAHRDGVTDEAAAYAQELEWYETLRAPPALSRLTGEERRAWDWAIESAVLSARKARERSGA